MKSNKKSGTEFEEKVAARLHYFGCWVHLLTQDKRGQPADMIAAKNNKAILIDAKECKSNRFPFSRIENNQRDSMTFYNICGNDVGYFVLGLNDEMFVFSLPELEKMELTKQSMNAAEIKQGIKIEEWVNKVWK